MKKVKFELNGFQVKSFITESEKKTLKSGLEAVAPTKDFTDPTAMTWCYIC
jgi:hypothetical protein